MIQDIRFRMRGSWDCTQNTMAETESWICSPESLRDKELLSEDAFGRSLGNGCRAPLSWEGGKVYLWKGLGFDATSPSFEQLCVTSL